MKLYAYHSATTVKINAIGTYNWEANVKLPSDPMGAERVKRDIDAIISLVNAANIQSPPISDAQPSESQYATARDKLVHAAALAVEQHGEDELERYAAQQSVFR